MQVTLATFNVNSLAARMGNLLAWLNTQPVDILLLQETKTTDDQFPRLELEDRGYNLAIIGQKTYNGVCIASRYPIDDVITALPILEPDNTHDTQARYIEAVISLKGTALRVASAYVPNGMAVDCDKFTYKLQFLERLLAHWRERLQFHEMAVLGGDFNCAPDTLDVYDAARLEGSICYHHAERTRLRALMNLGLYDAFRSLHPSDRAYSWWDYRGGSFERGHGLRIDHMLLSPQAMDACKACWIDSSPRGSEKPSDHAPVLVTLTL